MTTIRFETDFCSTPRPRHVGRPASRFAASSQGVGRTHAHSDRVSRFALTVRRVGWSVARPREGDRDELRLVTRQRGTRMPPTARVASSCSASGRAARAARPTLTVRPRCVDCRSARPRVQAIHKLRLVTRQHGTRMHTDGASNLLMLSVRSCCSSSTTHRRTSSLLWTTSVTFSDGGEMEARWRRDGGELEAS